MSADSWDSWECQSCYTDNWKTRTECRWCGQPGWRQQHARPVVRRWQQSRGGSRPEAQARPDLQEALPDLQALPDLLEAQPDLQEALRSMMVQAVQAVRRNQQMVLNTNPGNHMPTAIHIAPKSTPSTRPQQAILALPAQDAQQAQPAQQASSTQQAPPPPPASPAPSTQQVLPQPPPPPGPPPPLHSPLQPVEGENNIARWCRLNDDLGGGLARLGWTKDMYEQIFGQLSANRPWGDRVWAGLRVQISSYWEYRWAHKGNNSHSNWVPGSMHGWASTFRPPENFSKNNAAAPQSETNPPGRNSFPAVVYLNHSQHSGAMANHRGSSGNSSSRSSSSSSSGSSSSGSSYSTSTSTSSSSSTTSSSSSSSSIPETGEPVCIVCLGIMVNAGQPWWVWSGWIELHAPLEEQQ
jgi:hypothetical protein